MQLGSQTTRRSVGRGLFERRQRRNHVGKGLVERRQKKNQRCFDFEKKRAQKLEIRLGTQATRGGEGLRKDEAWIG